MSGGVHYEIEQEIGTLTLDDGKANAISFDLIAEINALVDRIESERSARALVITGRPGRFCAGFDLRSMTKDNETARELVGQGARLATRLYTLPLPLVIACTGHAMAMGAILLHTADRRIGSQGSFKIGMNEVAIGLTMPLFAVDLSRDRLASPYLNRAVVNAETFTPDEALRAGFFDRLVAPEELTAAAMAEARTLVALDPVAFGATTLRVREQTVERIESALAADLLGIDVTKSGTPR